jgi:hypothetical protein
MLLAMLHCDNFGVARRHARNSPSAFIRRSDGSTLALPLLLGFNLNNICYLFVATFNFRPRAPRQNSAV